MAERSHMVNVRMSDAEVQMIADLAEHMGLSQSDVIRQLIRRAHAVAHMGNAKPSPKRRKRSK